MARYGSADASISLGGTTVLGVTDIGEVVPEALIEEITEIGSDWQEHDFVGVKRADSFDISGPHSDEADHISEVIAIAFGTKVECIITFGSGVTMTFDVLVTSRASSITRNQLTIDRAPLVPTGAITFGP